MKGFAVSVVERLEDAYLMMQNGRFEGALNSVLTAISGASRQRYRDGVAMSRWQPGRKMGDREAFETFLDEQVDLLRAPRLRIRVQDEDHSFGNAMYKLFRCALTHEAGLYGGGKLVPDPTAGHPFFRLTSLDPLGFEISHSAIIFLADLVARAPELGDAATDVRARIMSRLPTRA